MIPARVVEVRQEICARCDVPCDAYRTGLLNHSNPRESCPRVWPGRWGCYGPCEGPGEARPALGLGDAVEIIAQPIARAADAILGTNLAGCGGCRKRKAALNAAIPDVRNPLG